MAAKINHVAIVSENYAAEGQFYQAVFGLKSSGHLRPVGLGIGREGEARLQRFKDTCPLGTFHMADRDGVLIDVHE